MALLRGWAAGGAHRRDLDKDGRYDDDDAVTLMDAWWPRLVAGASSARRWAAGRVEALRARC